jgi:hypothetical protein
VLLGLSSLATYALLNFQLITGYYENNRNKTILTENVPNNKPYSPYHILKDSALTDEFFLRYGIPEKWIIFVAFARKKSFLPLCYLARKVFD